MYRKPVITDDALYVYKGNHFHKLCYTSFPEWAKMLIDEATGSHPKPFYDEMELRMMFKERTNGQQRWPNISKVVDFLSNYKHNGEHSLGYIEKDERTNYFQLSEHWVPLTNKDNTGINWKEVDLL